MQYGLAVSDNHYFDENPNSPSNRQKIEVELGGKSISISTDSGVFSSNGVDKGTQILLKHTAFAVERGEVIDLGSGWGPISIHLALINPKLRIRSVDINSRANQLLQENITNLSLENIECTTLDEIAADSIDQIWSNPPIRIGKQSLHELLMQAFSKLKAGGEAFLVVQKHLGSDSLAKWLETEQGHEVQRLDNSKGFRVLRVTKK